MAHGAKRRLVWGVCDPGLPAAGSQFVAIPKPSFSGLGGPPGVALQEFFDCRAKTA